MCGWETPANPLWPTSPTSRPRRTLRRQARRPCRGRFDGCDAGVHASALALGARSRHVFGDEIHLTAIPTSSPAPSSPAMTTLIGDEGWNRCACNWRDILGGFECHLLTRGMCTCRPARAGWRRRTRSNCLLPGSATHGSIYGRFTRGWSSSRGTSYRRAPDARRFRGDAVSSHCRAAKRAVIATARRLNVWKRATSLGRGGKP